MKVVIVGAGPAGLMLALHLEKLGFEVTLVDPRVDHYIRPGYLQSSVFNEVNHSLNTKIQYSPSQHIKDLEHELLALVKAKGNIKIIPGSFVDFDQKNVRFQLSDKSQHTIPADLVVDASGSKRAVLKVVNSIKPTPPPFTVKTIDTAPPSHFLFAYGTTNEFDRQILSDLKNDKISTPTLTFEQFQELREMGWDEFINPYFHFKLLNKKKVMFYVGIPENLDPDQNEMWLQKLIAFNTGNPKFHFEKIPENLKDPEKSAAKSDIRFQTFTVHPNRVLEAYYQDKNLPPIVSIGEARFFSFFQMGMGITFCIRDVEAFCKCISKVKENQSDSFTIDFEKFARLSEGNFNAYLNELESFHNRKKEALPAMLLEKMHQYKTVIDSMDAGKDRTVLFKEYQQICGLYTKVLYELGVFALEKCFRGNNSFTLDQHNFIGAEEIKLAKKSIEQFHAALAHTRTYDPIEANILTKLKGISAAYIKAGDFYVKSGQFGFAKNCYQEAKTVLVHEKLLAYTHSEILSADIKFLGVCCEAKMYSDAELRIKEVDSYLKKNQVVDQTVLNHYHYLKLRVELNLMLVEQTSFDQLEFERCKERSRALQKCKRLSSQQQIVLNHLQNKVEELSEKSRVIKPSQRFYQTKLN